MTRIEKLTYKMSVARENAVKSAESEWAVSFWNRVADQLESELETEKKAAAYVAEKHLQGD